jgi:ribosome-associated heat shock protein Hsp15
MQGTDQRAERGGMNTGSEPSSTQAGAARIDRWLFAVRLAGSRVLAAQAVSGGRVHVNGERVKAAHPVRPGDIVTFKRGALAFECAVERIPARRGPAREARLCYTENAASAARRVEFARQMKVAGALTIRPDHRPEKHERARLRRLKGRI